MNSMSKSEEIGHQRLDLHGAYIPRTSFRRSDLTRANLSGADCRWVNFSGALLRQANLSNADLANANLSGADLADANFAGASLKGANLVGAINLTSEQLSKAVIDEQTILPDYLMSMSAK